MSLGETINGSVTNLSSVFSYYAVWSAVQSVTGNYSDVTVTTYWATSNTNYKFNTSATRSVSITINGEKDETAKKYDCDPWPAGGVIEVHSVTKRIYHNNDGTKSITIETRANGTANNSYGRHGPSYSTATSDDCTTPSTTYTLDTIPRAATITSASNITDTSGASLSYTNPAGSAVSGIAVAIALTNSTSATPLIGYKTGLPIDGTNYLFTLSNEELNSLLTNTSSKTRTIYYILRTTIGGAYQYDTKSATFTVTKGPNVGLVTRTPDNTAIESGVRSRFDGLYVQTLSKVSVSITASARTGSTITNYSTGVDGQTYSGSSFTSALLTRSGTLAVSTTVTDSRGLTGAPSSVPTITVLPYATPSVVPPSGATAVQCYRSNSSGVAQDDSTTIWIKAKRSYSPVTSDGTALNKCTLRYRYKLASSSSWGGWTTLRSTTATSDEYNAAISGTFAITSAYSFEISVLDEVGNSSSISFSIPTDDVPLHLGDGGKNIAFGKYADTTRPNLVESAWNIEIAKAGSTAVVNRVKNGLAAMSMEVTATGRRGIWDTNSGTWIIYKNDDDGITRIAKVSNISAVASGQILTSFKESVAMGSYGTAQTTLAGFVGEVRYSSGAMGSVSINTAYTNGGVTIPAGWYNFMYSPHRTGGVNGSAQGDNADYGNLILMGMNNANGMFRVRVSTGSIAEVIRLEAADYVVETSTATTTGLATSWTVRKWASGYCEAYAKTDSTGYPMTQTYTNGYYYAATQSLPSSLFTSVDYGQVDRCAGTSASGLISASLYNLSTTQVQWYAFDTRSETVDCSFAIRIVGKWK